MSPKQNAIGLSISECTQCQILLIAVLFVISPPCFAHNWGLVLRSKEPATVTSKLRMVACKTKAKYFERVSKKSDYLCFYPTNSRGPTVTIDLHTHPMNEPTAVRPAKTWRCHPKASNSRCTLLLGHCCGKHPLCTCACEEVGGVCVVAALTAR